MNNFLKAIATALMVLAMPVAQAMEGNDLLAGYNSYTRVKSGVAAGRDAYEAGVFDGYVSGVFDSAVGIMFCAPADIKGGGILDAVGQFVEAHPESRQRSAVKLATQALMQSFPCK